MILKERIDKLKRLGKTPEYIIENLRNSLCSQALRREFGQSMESFLAENPAENQLRKDILETITFIESEVKK